ncbi:transposase domain-containing protein [Saccharibacter floricola]|uniref:Integrase n=1 Tax=Saccharibacter floricola DSM 15669 TaxID=1123227 RepID=A0ABQ0P1Q6_9PROT|nr:transposase domain-containing protein [Saccharibacter floricola]GBQ08906.1 integrase [Saccharibacter floricola DSM 15669]
MKTFATLQEIANLDLPNVPGMRALHVRAERNNWLRPEWEGVYWRPRSGAGGGVEYSYKLLPKVAQLAWVQRFLDCSDRQPDEAGDHGLAWERYHEASASQKAKALETLRIMEMIEQLYQAGWSLHEALTAYNTEQCATVGRTTVMGWKRTIRNVPREHWLAYLVPKRKGPKASHAQCSEEAWDFLKADWLRPEKPTISACYRRLQQAAEEHGWTFPCEKTLARWLHSLPIEVVTLAREGRDKVKDLIPAQERDRTHLHALQAVNADGHKWDVRVQWPDGTIGRPMMVAWQDLYSGMILSWRVDRSENTDAIQLALGDLVEKYGIPSRAYLDNGRAFASKRMTGGTKTRFRFKVREGDAAGVMTILGIETVFVTPYSGQSKPIERAFRDLAGDLAKHPALAGAYTGNNPTNKPANYGDRAVPLAEFLAVISAGIDEHNNRTGRRTAVCKGVKSFRQVFEESLAHCAVRKPTQAQRHLWLRAAENVMASKRDGSFRFLGNRYWAEFLHEHMGQPLVVRFDPQELHAPMHVYSLNGGFLGDAPVVEKTGFDSTAAAAVKKRAEKQLAKAAKMKLDAESRLTPSELAALLPDHPEDHEALMDQKVVTPFRPNAAVTQSRPAPLPETDDEDDDGTTASILHFMRRSA